MSSDIVRAGRRFLPEFRGLSLREVWDLEDKLDDAKALVSDYIDSEIRRLAGEVGRSSGSRRSAGAHSRR
jgi:hypothetical protein